MENVNNSKMPYLQENYDKRIQQELLQTLRNELKKEYFAAEDVKAYLMDL